MTQRVPRITQDAALRLIDYNPNTGDLVWKERTQTDWDGPLSRLRTWNTRYAGTVAGRINSQNGYRYVSIAGVFMSAHRLIWLMVHGTAPEQIDHINHERDDNRLINLRPATNEINARNITRPQDNTSGRVGVYWHKRAGKWMAQIVVDGRAKYLGLYGDIECAITAREAAERRFGFHANHGLPANDNTHFAEAA